MTGEGTQDGGLTRRAAMAAAASSAALAGVAPAASARRRRPPAPAIGAGGAPTDPPALARLARDIGGGEPVMFVDLAAVDRNIATVLAFARDNGFAVRPALKAFACPRLSAYILQRLPAPLGLVFHLGHLDAHVHRAPPGTDFLMGYPPTAGELTTYLSARPPRRQRKHRLQILVDSVALLELLARLARTTPRRLPLDVALELDSGMGRGGMDSPGELSAAIAILRAERERVRLTGVLCYDGHATLNGDSTWRRTVATDARRRYRAYLEQLAAEAADLYDPATLVRNGPASSNYRNWAGTTEANEISPGSAFVFPHYLESFDHEGLAPALYQAAPLMRITSDHPSVPGTQTTLPGSTREEILVKGGGWPSAGGTTATVVHPPGTESDELSGGGNAFTVPKGAVEFGDYLLFRPEQSEEGVLHFGALVAVREGRAVRVWPSLPRWGTPSER